MARPIRVMCVDDSAFIAEALRARLSVENGIEWVGHLPTADGLVPEAERLGADVVLLDLEMPGRDPFEALTELAQRARPQVVVLSGDLDPLRSRRAREAGAVGMVNKSEDPTEIVAAIRRAGGVADGGGQID